MANLRWRSHRLAPMPGLGGRFIGLTRARYTWRDHHDIHTSAIVKIGIQGRACDESDKTLLQTTFNSEALCMHSREPLGTAMHWLPLDMRE